MDKEIKFECIMNTETKESSVSVSPEPENFEDMLLHYSNVINASVVMLRKLLACFPTIREATEEERALKTYIYTSDNDRKLIKWRKAIYEDSVKLFTSLFDSMFIDVVYTDSCKSYAENLAFEESEEFVDNYTKQVEKLRIKILDNLIKEAKESESDEVVAVGELLNEQE